MRDEREPIRVWSVPVRRLALMILVAAGCGDQRVRAVTFDPVSGSRLRVTWDLFGDGSRLWQTDAFYDAELHIGCTPRAWLGGGDRCVPTVEEAVYTDDACSQAVGRATSMLKPSYFLASDDGQPAALYRAGDATATPASYYRRSGGGCIGPYFADAAATYYATTEELGGDALVALGEERVGTARLATRVRTGSDGMRVPLALVDGELDVDCHVVAHDDGAACEPVDVPIADAFADASCSEPALVAAGPGATIAQVPLATGCAGYRAVGAEVAAAYRLDRGACVPLLATNVHFFSLGAAIEPAPVERDVESTGHRLERIVAADAGLRIAAGLVDTATRAECIRYSIDEITRCIPADTLPEMTAYAAGCQAPLRVVAVPVRTCAPIAFAISNENGFAVHAIGEPFTGTVYTYGEGGRCAPYTPPTDVVLRALGPPLPADTFLAAHAYGDR